MEKRIGRYQILDEIASGGQGTVYRAFDPDSGQIVALKVLHPSLSGDRSYIERFRREASLAASIDHPNVVRIFEVGQDGDRHFMALEFLPESLARVIESGGQMRTDGAARFGVQIAEGLAAAHALGIVHRDVKPQNVLIGPDGSAKVTDFGIARGESFSTMTATGVVMGTPHYMSPEQARGERSDPRSDVYSLGCMLYHMLAGEVPFKGDTPLAVIRQQIEERPRRLREVRRDLPGKLESVVDRAMAKDPEKRYQSAADMGQALRAAVPGVATPAGVPRRTPTPPPLPSAPQVVPRRSSRLWGLIRKTPGVMLVLWGLFLLLIGQNNVSEGVQPAASLLLAAGALNLVGGFIALRRRGIAFGPLGRGRLTGLLVVAGLVLFIAGGGQQADDQPGPDLPSSGATAAVSAVDLTPTPTRTPAPFALAPTPSLIVTPTPPAPVLQTLTQSAVPVPTFSTATTTQGIQVEPVTVLAEDVFADIFQNATRVDRVSIDEIRNCGVVSQYDVKLGDIVSLEVAFARKEKKGGRYLNWDFFYFRIIDSSNDGVFGNEIREHFLCFSPPPTITFPFDEVNSGPYVVVLYRTRQRWSRLSEQRCPV